MKQRAFFCPHRFERDRSGMQGIVTDLAQGDQIGFLIRNLATDGLHIPAVTMTNAPLKPMERENRPMF